MKTSLRLLAALALPLLSQAARADWPDTYLSRLQAHALLQTLHASILAGSSATLTLEKWCADHSMAAQPQIRARLLRGENRPPSAEQRLRLEVEADTPVNYRRVQLYCGDHLMSEADNWYVPGRLTPAMNRQLEETDTPFGKAVLPLAPYRRTFAARILWSPLPDGWERAPQPPETAPGASLAMPAALFEHSAMLYTAGHLPIAEVRETYQRGVLSIPAPHQALAFR